MDQTERISKTSEFLQKSEWYLRGARCLHDNFSRGPTLMFVWPILCHYCIELMLKACYIWEKYEDHPETHNLLTIANEVNFLNLSEEDKNLLRKTYTMYYFRYPLNEKNRKIVEENLAASKDTVYGTNITPLPEEIGTDDWDKVMLLYDHLIDSMSTDEDLIKIYREIQSFWPYYFSLNNDNS